MTPIPSPALDPGIPPALWEDYDNAAENYWGAIRSDRMEHADIYFEEMQKYRQQIETSLRSSISDALREATRVERERCAKVICMACHYGMLHENGECTAAAIRRSPTSDATNGR